MKYEAARELNSPLKKGDKGGCFFSTVKTTPCTPFIKGESKYHCFSVLLLFVLLFAGHAYAAPPAQPMVIHGEILAEGKILPEGTELKVSVKGQEISLKTANTAEGLSIYTLKIHAYNPNKPEKPGEVRAKEGDEIRFLSLGKYTLAQMPSLKWKQGLIVKKDLLVNQVLQNSPSFMSASATQNGDKWVLKCKIGPLQQEKPDSSLISYKVKWFYKKTKEPEQAATDGKKADEVVLVKEETLKDVKADKESEITYDGPTKGMKYFEVVVTPEMIPDGAKGPSAVKNVFPIVTQGGI